MKPFDPQIPSVFSIDTPFQALCAIAAIRQLKIIDYKMIAYFPQNEVRNAQLYAILEKYCVKYKAVKPFNRFTYRYSKWSALRSHHSRYRRLFIGDLRDMTLYYTSLRYVNDGTDIVYLDDGNITISYLKGIINEPLRLEEQAFLHELELRRGVVTNKNILTIYDHIDNPQYNIRILDLSLIISQQQKGKKMEGVYIVGTNIDSFCGSLEIEEDKYIEKLEELIISLKKDYPGEKVVFVPHGKDKSEYARRICDKYVANFEPSEMTVELKLISQQIAPKAVYGFTSSALYNIKKIFPQTKVVNVLYEENKENPFFEEYMMCSDYYLENGIELLKEKI